VRALCYTYFIEFDICLLIWSASVVDSNNEHVLLVASLQVWSLFNEIICPTTNVPIGLRCAVQNCNARLASCTNTTNARQHLSYVHKSHLAELEAEVFEDDAEGSDEAAPRVQSVISKSSTSWPPGKRDQLTRKVVYWLCKRARPLSLQERDTELFDVLMFASDGAYSMPTKNNVVRQLCVKSGRALAHDRQKVARHVAGGVLPSSGTVHRCFHIFRM